MAYCSAYPIRKMVPKDRMTEQCACTCDDYSSCALFTEVMGRLRPPTGAEPAAGSCNSESKEDRK